MRQRDSHGAGFARRKLAIDGANEAVRRRGADGPASLIQGRVRERLLIVATTIAVLALLCWPATWPKGRDSFPLSPYPMFARKKTSPNLTMEYALAFDAQGKQSFVAPEYIGSGEVLQARALIHGAIARGGSDAARFCEDVLGRVRADNRAIVELRLVRGSHDSVAYLQGDTSSSVEKVLTTCRI